VVSEKFSNFVLSSSNPPWPLKMTLSEITAALKNANIDVIAITPAGLPTNHPKVQEYLANLNGVKITGEVRSSDGYEVAVKLKNFRDIVVFVCIVKTLTAEVRALTKENKMILLAGTEKNVPYIDLNRLLATKISLSQKGLEICHYKQVELRAISKEDL